MRKITTSMALSNVLTSSALASRFHKTNASKIAISAAYALTLGLAIIANAQEANGVFIGFETGAGETQINMKGTDLRGVEWDDKTSGVIGVYGGKIGYKHFFNDYFGLRGYASLDYAILNLKYKNAIANTNAHFSTFTYAANIDALVNFYETQGYSLGAFAGVGLGGQNYSSSPNFSALISSGNITNEENLSGFYADAKVGLRVVAGQHHGMDFIVKIPFTNATKTINGVDIIAKQNYQILLGYNFSF